MRPAQSWAPLGGALVCPETRGKTPEMPLNGLGPAWKIVPSPNLGGGDWRASHLCDPYFAHFGPTPLTAR